MNYPARKSQRALPSRLSLFSSTIRWVSLALGVLGVVSLIASGVNAVRTGFPDYPQLDTTAEKLVTQYSYFTVLSAIVMTACLFFFAVGGAASTSVGARILRLEATMMVVITGLVYNFVLADGTPKHGLSYFTNLVHHQLFPVLMPLLWLGTVPLRRSRDVRTTTVVGVMMFPLLWVVYTFIRGAHTGFYPYFFMDAGDLGLAQAMLNTAAVFGVFFVLVGLLGAMEALINKGKWI